MEFFSRKVGVVFVDYGWSHWAMMSALAIAIALTVIFRSRLRAHPFVRRWLPTIIGIVPWTLEIIFHWWAYTDPREFIVDLLPFELCYISLICTTFLCATRSRALFGIYYFISVGALVSVLFPDQGGYDYDNFRFWHYFLIHSYIVWLTAWFLAVEGYVLKRSAFWRLLAVMVPLATIVRIIDWRFTLNYMFLAGPSANPTPLDYFGTGPMYLVKFVGLAIGVFFVMYLLAPKEPKPAPGRRDAVLLTSTAQVPPSQR